MLNTLAIDMLATSDLVVDNLRKACHRHRLNNFCIKVFLVIIFFTKLAICQLFDKIKMIDNFTNKAKFIPSYVNFDSVYLGIIPNSKEISQYFER